MLHNWIVFSQKCYNRVHLMLSDVAQPVIMRWSLLDNDVVNVVYRMCDTYGRTIDYIRVDPSNSATSVIATLGHRNVVRDYIRVNPSNTATSVVATLGYRNVANID